MILLNKDHIAQKLILSLSNNLKDHNCSKRHCRLMHEKKAKIKYLLELIRLIQYLLLRIPLSRIKIKQVTKIRLKLTLTKKFSIKTK
jgi:hypothetical protein